MWVSLDGRKRSRRTGVVRKRGREDNAGAEQSWGSEKSGERGPSKLAGCDPKVGYVVLGLVLGVAIVIGALVVWDVFEVQLLKCEEAKADEHFGNPDPDGA